MLTTMGELGRGIGAAARAIDGSGARPLSLRRAIAIFGGFALLARACVYGLLPRLIEAGAAPFWAFLGSYGLFLTLMIALALAGARREGYRLSAATLAGRFRFRRLGARDWAWTLGLFAVGFLGSGLLAPTQRAIASIPAFAPPPFLPAAVNPLAPQALVPEEFMGLALRGNWWIVAAYAVFLLGFNILGEELWFRGYLLPRQELRHGQFAWLCHGILWTLFHVPIYPWAILSLLPTALSVSYAAQRLRNTRASFAIHALGNGLLVLVPLILGVAR